jgi:hypothetical protein
MEWLLLIGFMLCFQYLLLNKCCKNIARTNAIPFVRSSEGISCRPIWILGETPTIRPASPDIWGRVSHRLIATGP